MTTSHSDRIASASDRHGVTLDFAIDASPRDIDLAIHSFENILGGIQADFARATRAARSDLEGWVADRKGSRGLTLSTLAAQAIADAGERVEKIEEYVAGTLDKLEKALAPLRPLITQVQGILAPLAAQYDARRWSRFFHVSNTNGHVHSSTSCGTCFPTTEFGWHPEWSGETETQLVARVGETACTVCYPSAPTLKGFDDGTSDLAKLDAAAKAAKAAEKAAKLAQKNAAQVVVPGIGYNGRTKVFKTERGATNAMASELRSMVNYGFSHPSNEEWKVTVLAISEVVAERQGVDLETFRWAALERAVKAHRRDCRKHGSEPRV